MLIRGFQRCSRRCSEAANKKTKQIPTNQRVRYKPLSTAHRHAYPGRGYTSRMAPREKQTEIADAPATSERAEKFYMENTLLRVSGALFCHDAKLASSRIKKDRAQSWRSRSGTSPSAPIRTTASQVHSRIKFLSRS